MFDDDIYLILVLDYFSHFSEISVYILAAGRNAHLFYGDGALTDGVVSGGEVVVHEIGRVLVRSRATGILHHRI